MRFSGAGTGQRRFDGNLQNEALVNVLADAKYARNGDTITNTGVFFIAPEVAFIMEAGNQVFNQDSNSLVVQGAFKPKSITFNFNGGNVTGNPVTLTSSTLNIGPNAVNGTFVLRSTSNYSGDLEAGQFLTVLSDIQTNTFDSIVGNPGIDLVYDVQYLARQVVVDVVSSFPGDFDLDYDVDGADVLLWQRGGSPNPLSGSDLTKWTTNFGTIIPPATTAATTIPEPNTGILLLLGLASLLGGKRDLTRMART